LRGQGEAEFTEVVFGLRAGLALFAHRSNDIARIFYDAREQARLRALVRWASANAVPCHAVSQGELERAAHSTHHEGLCVISRQRRWASVQELARYLASRKGAAIALDRVRNPYNIGAMVRSASFFGIDAAILGAPAPHPGIAPTAVRVAEGGAERVMLSRTTDLAHTLARLRSSGVRVVGADPGARSRANDVIFPRPVVLVVGNERDGLGARVRGQCDTFVGIPGRAEARSPDAVTESLNVSVAAGVLMFQLIHGRQRS
jgi:TrmH RNA methyltransferase